MAFKIVELLGTIGGTSIALSLVPQVIRTYRTKSATDISYVYQAVYIFGITLVNIYAFVEGLWPVYIPAVCEETLIVSLTVMKFQYDRRDNSQKKAPSIDDDLEKEAKGSIDADNTNDTKVSST